MVIVRAGFPLSLGATNVGTHEENNQKRECEERHPDGDKHKKKCLREMKKTVHTKRSAQPSASPEWAVAVPMVGARKIGH